MTRPISLRPLGLLALMVFALGCEDRTRTDAAGVEVWRVDSLPAVSIGLDDSDNLDAAFVRITGATRLPDGRILVADLGDVPLKLFAQDGAFIRRVARRGKGPREIEYLARLFRCGTSIFTYDIDGYRIQQWSLEAEFERELRFPMPPLQQTPYASACNAAGRFVHVGWGARGVAKAGYHRDTAIVWTTVAADSQPLAFDSVPSSERWGQTHEGRIVGSMPLPLGKQPIVAVGPTRLYIATGDAPGVRAYDFSGSQLAPLVLADSAPPVTPEDVQALIERDVLSDGEPRRRAIERSYGEIEFQPTKSNATAMLVDSEGNVWVRPPVSANATSVIWQVFTADGKPRATVALPSEFVVLEIGADYVLGRTLDRAAGVPLLQMYRPTRLLDRD